MRSGGDGGIGTVRGNRRTFAFLETVQTEQ